MAREAKQTIKVCVTVRSKSNKADWWVHPPKSIAKEIYPKYGKGNYGGNGKDDDRFLNAIKRITKKILEKKASK